MMAPRLEEEDAEEDAPLTCSGGPRDWESFVFLLSIGESGEEEEEGVASLVVVDEGGETVVLPEDSEVVRLEEDEVVLGATPMVVMTEGVPGKLKSFLPSSQLACCADRRLMQKYVSVTVFWHLVSPFPPLSRSTPSSMQNSGQLELRHDWSVQEPRR
jgi:hypothetical protein